MAPRKQVGSTKAKPASKKRIPTYVKEEMEFGMNNSHMERNKESNVKNSLSYKLSPKFKNDKQKNLYNTIMDKETRIMFLKGSPGTGKTFVSLLAGLMCLKDPNINIGKLILTKTLVQSAKNDTGYLKGTLNEKIEPYFAAFYDVLDKLIGKSYTDSLVENSLISNQLLNFMRGTTLSGYNNATEESIGYFIVVDEAQNLDKEEMKTLLTRLGNDSKMIVLGDVEQQDTKKIRNEMNGLEDACLRFKGIKGIEFFEFGDEDIVREKLIIDIMKAYRKDL